MLAFTFSAPPESGRGPIILVLIIERENMARMTIGDPLDMRLASMASASPLAEAVLKSRLVTDLDIIVAYEDPEGVQIIRDFARQNDMAGVIKHIERGRTVYDGEPGDPVLDT